ncbi:bifunctional 4-hydroxy-2-oxoglutarate aldolase/2-dehydro-3-deoxy-phosphogluconate aldolase [Thermomicrobium sp. 4228-Ro]|uniref:bifunctional 4-hydroxy-2-oxoglutarate aldolase/2-dehydro-3-deoxy-phosphogluconate aldolase n=1 Tax=Thermomicrobium sp. 4228-Ro TaxID=2993937 RepID=UPI0022493986|nr:bifunctional 4-hydroxy-2-oxoglutarate aldolase/2-dehydro-3-deoxy-phosphogluconate aldolase [Thermomicrobium sp. 4228-Ro]MCX2727333.1 bifunctional 4-hydroxy-2-oxoglutarate aldolase/2-dehydro-3-deoxy-phosphogluconate aldolase [Thermomicrobium sp. 4228-Ro]
MTWIETYRLIAVIRLDDLSCAERLAEALYDGGVRVLEFTYTNREAGRAIEQVRRRFDGLCLVGAGTVLDAETARQAMLSGAQFIVTPTLRRETIEICRRYAITSVIGAFTPTEILTAWEWGADYIKVNPASLAGPSYFKDVLAPLPQVKLIPSGGVTLETAPAFLAAGAVAVAVGSHLVDRQLVAQQDWAALRERARRWAELVARPERGVPVS